MRLQEIIRRANSINPEVSKEHSPSDEPELHDLTVFHRFGPVEDKLIRGLHALLHQIGGQLRQFIDVDIRSMPPHKRRECVGLKLTATLIPHLIASETNQLYVPKIPEHHLGNAHMGVGIFKDWQVCLTSMPGQAKPRLLN